MTLRDYVWKSYPSSVDEDYVGGVFGCPDDYEGLKHISRYCDDANEDAGTKDEVCRKCWNREYVAYSEKTKQDVTKENVEHPSHYNAHNIEVIDFIQDWELNFCLGNVIKYVCRSPYKGTQIEDLKKAREYLDFEIKRLEKE